MAGEGKKALLCIQPCKKGSDPWQVENEPRFVAQLNPSGFRHSQGIGYNTETPQGKARQEAKFSTVSIDKVGFSFVLDATGVVQPAGSIADRIDTLRKVAYDYQGDKHEPNVVRILWGSFLFYGRLESLGLEYTLFAPSGEPLRAKVDLGFIGTMGSKAEACLANRSSPDLTHVIEVRAGDSLPLLCHRIYGDAAYYPAVARFNGIANFRALRPGRKLVFPPLR